MNPAFFTLHRDLPREGPGEPADVAWASDLAGVARDARICDAGCGPGADIAALLAAAPEGRVTAYEQVPHFVSAARAAHAGDARVELRQADMSRLSGPYDFIWSAGAVYFLGVTQALRGWRPALAAGGAVAFSQIAWRVPDPPEEAQAFWAAGYPDMTDAAGVADQVTAAGFETLGTRWVSDAAWEAYFAPIDARAAMLEREADAALQAVLAEARAEADIWRRHRAAFGYLLSVVRVAV